MTSGTLLTPPEPTPRVSATVKPLPLTQRGALASERKGGSGASV